MAVTIVGNNTPTAGGVVYGDGTNYASTAAGTSGQYLQSAGAGVPTWAAAPSTSGGATVTNPMSSNVTLTASSNRVQVFTPSAQGFTVTLPDATTINAAGGPIFELQNTIPEYPIAVMDSSGTNVGWIVCDYQSSVYLTSTASATGNWVIKTGNPAADGGIYPYDASYGADGSWKLQRTFGIGLSKNLFVGMTGTATSNYGMYSFVGTDASRTVDGGNANAASTQAAQYCYAACPLSSSTFFNIYQATATSRYFCYVTSVAVNGSTTKGTELDIGAANNAGYPSCVAIDGSNVLVYYNGPNASNFAVAQLITVSGTTCTLGSTLGSSSNVVGASISSGSSIAVLSSTRAHFIANNAIYSISISGSTISLLGSGTLPNGTAVGIVPVTSTTSMVFGSSGGKIVANIATDSSGTFSFGSTSSGFLPTSTATAVSKIATGTALVILGGTSLNRFGENNFAIVKSISSVPTLMSRGYLPSSLQVQTFIYPQSGVAVCPITSGDSSSNSTSAWTFKKIAITGGV
jgi:hypothetical protein